MGHQAPPFRAIHAASRATSRGALASSIQAWGQNVKENRHSAQRAVYFSLRMAENRESVAILVSLE
jgi:hypothetical protein